MITLLSQNINPTVSELLALTIFFCKPFVSIHISLSLSCININVNFKLIILEFTFFLENCFKITLWGSPIANFFFQPLCYVSEAWQGWQPSGHHFINPGGVPVFRMAPSSNTHSQSCVLIKEGCQGEQTITACLETYGCLYAHLIKTRPQTYPLDTTKNLHYIYFGTQYTNIDFKAFNHPDWLASLIQCALDKMQKLNHFRLWVSRLVVLETLFRLMCEKCRFQTNPCNLWKIHAW